MTIYYIIHILLFLSLFLYKSRIQIQLYLIFVWIVFITLFGGLRWEVGHDWENYLRIFNDSGWDNIFSYTRFDADTGEKFEPLYVFLNVLIKTLFGHYVFFNMFEVLTIQLAFLHFSRKMFPETPILCYSFLMLTSPAYIPVRITLAYAFVLLAYEQVRFRNFKKFLFYFIISVTIHKHTLIALPIYWIGYLHLNSLLIMAIYFSFYVLSKVFQDYFVAFGILFGGTYGQKLESLTYFETAEKVLSIMTVFLNLIFLGLYLYYRKITNKIEDNWYNALLNMFLIYCGIIFVFSEGMSDMVRMIDVYFPAQVILLISAFQYSIKQKKNILAVIVPVLFYIYCARRITQGFTDPFFEEVCIPYKTVFGF